MQYVSFWMPSKQAPSTQLSEKILSIVTKRPLFFVASAFSAYRAPASFIAGLVAALYLETILNSKIESQFLLPAQKIVPFFETVDKHVFSVADLCASLALLILSESTKHLTSSILGFQLGIFAWGLSKS